MKPKPFNGAIFGRGGIKPISTKLSPSMKKLLKFMQSESACAGNRLGIPAKYLGKDEK